MRRARARRARPWSDFTAQELFPRIPATSSTDRSARTRSSSTSRWSGVRRATASSAQRAPIRARASSSTSPPGRSGISAGGSGSAGRRDTLRRSSMRRRWAMEKTHDRKSRSSPRNRRRPRTTPTKVSDARSSGSLPPWARRYPSTAGASSRYSASSAAGSPARAASTVSRFVTLILVIGTNPRPGSASDQARRAEVVDRARLALRDGRLAQRPAVLDQHVGEPEPFLLGKDLHQVALDLVRVLLLGEPQALRHPADVRVDGDAHIGVGDQLLGVGVPEDDVRRLP